MSPSTSATSKLQLLVSASKYGNHIHVTSLAINRFLQICCISVILFNFNGWNGKIKNINPTGFLSLVKDGDLMFTFSVI
jgi:hypothetical protein